MNRITNLGSEQALQNALIYAGIENEYVALTLGFNYAF